MTPQDKNSEERTPPKKYLRLNYYGGTTTLGMLPRDTNWLKELVRFFGLAKKDQPSNEPKNDGSTPDY